MHIMYLFFIHIETEGLWGVHDFMLCLPGLWYCLISVSHFQDQSLCVSEMQGNVEIDIMIVCLLTSVKHVRIQVGCGRCLVHYIQSVFIYIFIYLTEFICKYFLVNRIHLQGFFW